MLKTIQKRKTLRTFRTLGQMVKAKLYRQDHTKKQTHTHSQKEKMQKIYIYISIYKTKKRVSKSINKSTIDNKL